MLKCPNALIKFFQIVVVVFARIVYNTLVMIKNWCSNKSGIRETLLYDLSTGFPCQITVTKT